VLGAYERRAHLLETLSDQGRLDVHPAAARLGVSAATVRRDLDDLARRRLLTRTRGGAVPVGLDLGPARLAPDRSAQRVRIARAVADLVPSGAVVGLNGGPGAVAVARELAARSGRDASVDGPLLTVVTNAIDVAAELAARPRLRVVMTGGAARPQSHELTGPLAVAALGGIALDLAVLAVDAVSPAFGATGHEEAEAGVARAMAERAGRVIVLADSARLGSRAFEQVCPVGDIDVLVTDDAVPDGLVQQFAAERVEVVPA
jgi:DeoR/GlpR family transcriptional regulator of sugar metabolism